MIRRLRRRPAFALLAAGILALGIGATAAVFSLIYGVLLRPPPYADPDELVLVSPVPTDGRESLGRRGWAAPQWEEWEQQAKSFESIAGYRWFFNFLVLEDGSESLEGMMVTENYFSVMGLEPRLGRSFVESDTDGSETPAIILGYDLWKRRYDGDPDIIGRTIRMSRSPPLTVVGVMPPDVRFLPSPSVEAEPNYDLHARVDYWLPLPLEARENAAWNVVARLRDGATPRDAQTELAVITARQAEANPVLEGVGAAVEPLSTVLNADGRRVLLPLLAAAGLVLLIACGNAAALLLVRALQRQHEYGLLSAVGAGRAALFRHVIAECLLISLLGGVLGAALAFGIVNVLKRIGGGAIPLLDAVGSAWPVLAFGLVAAALACVLAGLIPALRASRLNPVDALRAGGSKASAGRGQRRALGAVVIAQSGLTLALLVGAGLLIRTMYNLGGVDTGYETRNIVTMSVTSVEGDWLDFHERALERVKALPGVEAAGFAWGVPLTGNNWPGTVLIEGYTADDPSGRVFLPRRSVTPGYFDLLGQTIVEGRDFRQSDTRESGELVAIVNEAFVDLYVPESATAIGRRIWPQGRDGPSVRIVGVVSDTRTDDLTRAPAPELYTSMWQLSAFSKHLVVRTSTNRLSIADDVERELRAVEPTAAVENIKTLDEIRDESLASRSFVMKLLVGFAVVALVLTLGGIYSVLSLSVVARNREIAIRSAVGAGRRKIVGLVLRQGLGFVGGGVVVGAVIAIVLARALQAMLFEVGPADPVTLFGAAAALGVVALLACLLPALRASLIDPVEALKSE